MSRAPFVYLKFSKYQKLNCIGTQIFPPSLFYPLIRALSPHPCFIPSSVFYPLIRVLSPHPCFIPSSVFYSLIRVLFPHPYPCHPYPCFISSSGLKHSYVYVSKNSNFFVLSPHPCFIPSSVFYPLIRVLFPHPCFIPSSVSVSVPSLSVFYPNPV